MLAAGIAFAVGWAAIATLDRGFERKWRWLWIKADQDFHYMPRAYQISAILFPVELPHKTDLGMHYTEIDGFRFRFWFQVPRIYCERPSFRFERRR